jgi:hypothetical protein
MWYMLVITARKRINNLHFVACLILKGTISENLLKRGIWSTHHDDYG